MVKYVSMSSFRHESLGNCARWFHSLHDTGTGWYLTISQSLLQYTCDVLLSSPLDSAS